jgi:D-alanyl-D-alanine carboxypeptidase/D-alanyl-D-alanine-endopeptidase (penicillin-binding protein 4)
MNVQRRRGRVSAKKMIVRAAIAIALAGAFVAAAVAQPLNREVQTLISANKLQNMNVGVAVIDCDTKDSIVAYKEREALAPASNLKLLTSGTALLVLGKDFEFRTKLVRDGDKLVIVGAGDPALADPKLLKEMGVSVETFLDRLAEAVKESGFAEIREVVIDDRIFDRNQIHPSWPKAQLDKWYCAPITGLNFYTNVLEIFPSRASRAGSAPEITTAPSAGFITINNVARTVDSDVTAVGATQEDIGQADFRFKFYGNLRNPPDEPIEVTVRNPSLLLGRLIAARLGKMGLGAGGTAPLARMANETEKFSTLNVLAQVKTKLPVLLQRCNTDSQNLYAEALCKRVGFEVTGQPGSWENGAAIIRMQVGEKLGANPGELFISDGSGLSRDNRVTPEILARWLGAMHRDRNASEVFKASMANANEGKLEKRFKDKKLQGDVKAKTGFISGVMALSGYVSNAQTGRTVAFSIVVNAPRNGALNNGDAKRFQEDVVAAIDKWLARQPVRHATPKEEPAPGAQGG